MPARAFEFSRLCRMCSPANGGVLHFWVWRSPVAANQTIRSATVTLAGRIVSAQRFSGGIVGVMQIRRLYALCLRLAVQRPLTSSQPAFGLASRTASGSPRMWTVERRAPGRVVRATIAKAMAATVEALAAD